LETPARATVRGSVLHGAGVVATRLELTDDVRLEERGRVASTDQVSALRHAERYTPV